MPDTPSSGKHSVTAAAAQIRLGIHCPAAAQRSMAVVAGDDNGFTFVDGQLSFIGHDYVAIPEALVNKYAIVTTRLDLSFNCISSLKSLEPFKNLSELILDSNFIDDDTVFPELSLLRTLSLNKNKVVNLYGFLAKVRVSYPELHYLSLLGNAACRHQLSSQDNDDEDYQRYRHYVVYALPSLKFLDASAVTAAERVQARRVGPTMPTVQPPQEDDDASLGYAASSSHISAAYTPLPEENTAEYRHIGLLTKKALRYNGKHSEGNRFIKNNDL